jgi:cytochrome c553
MTSRSAWLALSLTIAGLAMAGQAAAADAARGEKLGYTCHGCHGIPDYKNAYPIYSVPKLGGQHAAYLVAALKGYASQERAHPTMHSHAVGMSGQDMQDVAAYLAATAPTASASCPSIRISPASMRTTSATRSPPTATASARTP